MRLESAHSPMLIPHRKHNTYFSAFTTSTQTPIHYVPCSLFYVSTQSFVPPLPGLSAGRGRFDSLLRSSRRVCAFWCLIWLVRPVHQVASCFPSLGVVAGATAWSGFVASE